ncbi:MAG TPA: EAL domain-containing protein [Nocardioides sp.]|uniref:putative bifunctional diguanylate cyclase/phosphodiesterase n=1 Tax=Nocardioides sp. TaxID=35761 RepID=UPI002EDACA16
MPSGAGITSPEGGAAAMTHAHASAHHDPFLVATAALLCLAGAWATSRFFQRMTDDRYGQRASWLFLTALASGVTIWCTHFVAMLGYHPGTPMDFDRWQTALSLAVAVLGSAAGFLVAGGDQPSRFRPALGGVLVGLAVASMHYVGMSALRVQGTVLWDTPVVAVSVACAVVLGAGALHVARRPLRHAGNLMWVLFAASVLLLHFVGMRAMAVVPSSVDATYTDDESLYVLAVTIAALSFVTIGAGAAGYLIDDRTRTAAVERFRRLALTDVLTGLPNRASFNERLHADIQRARRQGHRLALVVIDIDDFKEINDLRGHNVGDEVLSVLGGRMSELVREDAGAFIARVGGDEFVALVRVGEDRDLPGFLARLQHALSAPIHLDSDLLAPQASIGAAVFPDDAADAETLINNADLAMYRAKSDPLHELQVYDAMLDEQTRVRRGMAADLRKALERDELSLQYQVQTAVPSGEIRGYEALLRWQHPTLGPISPAEFIPLAEATGLIVPIGEWVLRTACAEAATWEPAYRVAVNVSAVQLARPGLVESVRSALADSGLPAERLELELTETALFTERQRAGEALAEIKALGVGIALDDFGTGYSSLDALRSFPFDRIKIDRSFFSGSGTPEQTVVLVQAVLSLGRTFGMRVLAEGIETTDQLALLTTTGCDEAQGYLFGRPTPVDEIVRAGDLRRSR